MNVSEQELARIGSLLKRKCIGFDIGGFRPDNHISSSWFGQVLLGSEHDEWPESNGKPMLPLAQINLDRLPFKPGRLDDISFISVFIDADRLPNSTPNGAGWKVQAYPTQKFLKPLRQPEFTSPIKPFPMRAKVIEEDYPCWEDVAIDLPEAISENYYELFQNTNGVKLGGWPSLIQSEIFWAPYNKHPAEPEYVFQIDTVPKAGWSWAHSGVGYFGRGTNPEMANEWVMEWQCY